MSRIAILYQDDTFGRAGLSGVMKAMEKRGMKLVAEGAYERNTTAVKMAHPAIRKADPQAVVMVGATDPLLNIGPPEDRVFRALVTSAG